MHKPFFIYGNGEERPFYKKFFNSLTKLKQHFCEEFKQSAKNPQQLLKIIKKVIPPKKFNFTPYVITTDDGVELKSPSDIAYYFNNFFCRSVGHVYWAMSS